MSAPTPTPTPAAMAAVGGDECAGDDVTSDVWEEEAEEAVAEEAADAVACLPPWVEGADGIAPARSYSGLPSLQQSVREESGQQYFESLQLVTICHPVGFTVKKNI